MTTTPDLIGLTFTDDIGTSFTVLGNRRWVEPTSPRSEGFYVWDVFNDSVVPGGAIVNISEASLMFHNRSAK